MRESSKRNAADFYSFHVVLTLHPWLLLPHTSSRHTAGLFMCSPFAFWALAARITPFHFHRTLVPWMVHGSLENQRIPFGNPLPSQGMSSPTWWTRGCGILHINKPTSGWRSDSIGSSIQVQAYSSNMTDSILRIQQFRFHTKDSVVKVP